MTFRGLVLAVAVVCVLAGLVSVEARNHPSTFAGRAPTEGDSPDSLRYIVEFKESHGGRRLAASDRSGACASAGAAVLEDLPPLSMTVVDADRRTRRRLRRDPRVKRLQRDRPRYLQATKDSVTDTLAHLARKLQSSEQQPYGVGLHGGPIGHSVPASDRARVCIIDSGYDISHPDLPDNSVQSDRVTTHQATSDAFSDPCEHGTHVAGTVTAISGNSIGVNALANVDLEIIKVFSGTGCNWSWASDLALAVTKCMEGGARVISMSLGGGGATNAERNAFANAQAAGVLSIAAAGNSGNTVLSYPASYDGVMSVAAIDSSKNLASFSQRNVQVEIAAAGVGVLSTLPGGGYASWSGTSMATPHVSACAGALMGMFPAASAADVRNAITTTAEDLGSAGRDNSFGFGMLRCAHAADFLGSCSRADPAVAVSAPTGAVDCSSSFPINIAITNNDDAECPTPREALVKATSATAAAYEFAAPVDTNPIVTNSFELIIRADNYAEETSFALTDSSGATVFSGALDGDDDGEELTFTYNDATFEEGELTFTFRDSYGDGICCSYGSGQYVLRMAGATVASGGEFEDLDVTTFDGTGTAVGAISSSEEITGTETIVVNVDAGAYEGEMSIEVATVFGGFSQVDTVTVTCSATTTPPADPTGLTVTAFTDESVSVSWTDNADNEAGYNVMVNGAAAATLGPNTESYTATGLAEDTDATIAVYATNHVGDSATLSVTQRTRLSKPTGLAASAIAQTTLDLTWDAVSATGATFAIEMSTDGGASWSTVSGASALAGSATSFSVTGLTAGTGYDFRITATNAAGDASEPSDTASATTLQNPPGTPAFTTATANPGMTVTLEWTDVSGETRYELTRSPAWGSGEFDGDLAAGSTSYTDTHVAPATTYTYTLTAFASDDTPSTGSATASVTTLAACVESPATAAATPTNIDVECGTGETVTTSVRLTNNDGATCLAEKLSMAAIADAAATAAGFSLDFGAGSTPINGAGSSGTSTLTIHITTDRYPGETSYFLRDKNGAEFEVDVDDTAKETLLSFEHHLDNDLAPWTFRLRDTYGDGICCGWGEGDLQLSYQGVTKDFTDDELKFGNWLEHELPYTAPPSYSGSAIAETNLGPGLFTDVTLTITVPAGGAIGDVTSFDLSAFRGPYAADATADSTSTVTVTCAAPNPPAAPLLLTIARGTPPQTTVALTWTPVADADGGYEVQYNPTASIPASGDWAGSAVFDSTATGGDVTGLDANTQYSFRIRSRHAVTTITSDWGVSVLSITTSPYAPLTPTAFGATLTDSNSKVLLQWDIDEEDGARPVTGYVLERDSGDGSGFQALSPAPAAGDDEYVDESGIVPDNTYVYRLTATNSAGSSDPSAETSVTTPAVCVYASPTLDVSVTNPPAGVACAKKRVYELSATVTSAHHPVCGGVEHTLDLSSIEPGYAVCNEFEVVVAADAFPLEFRVKAFDGSDATGTEIADGQLSHSDANGMKTFSWQLCPASGEVFFEVTDSAGDGLCCSHGSGNYRILQDGAEIYASADMFTGSSATHSATIRRTATASLNTDGATGSSDSFSASWSIVTTSETVGMAQLIASSMGEQSQSVEDLAEACATSAP